MERPAPTTGRPFACPGQAFRQLTQSVNESLRLGPHIAGMDPINAYPAAATDYAARRVVTPLKPVESAAPFSPNRDNDTTVSRKTEPLQAKPDQLKNREADEQVTRQRVDDKRMGTLFDLRA